MADRRPGEATLRLAVPADAEAYMRRGFVQKGCRREAVRLRSGYVDEWIMAKLLDPSP